MKLPPNEYAIDKASIPSAAEWRNYMDFIKSNRPDYPNIDAGLHLGIRGIEEDENGNYDEALKLYKESQDHLRHFLRDVTNGKVEKLIRRKCNELIKRGIVLRRHLNKNLHSENSIKCPAAAAAVTLANKGIEEDDNENYAEALRLYKEAEKYLLHSIEYEVKLDTNKDFLRKKWKLMTDRAKKLETILESDRIAEKLRQINCN